MPRVSIFILTLLLIICVGCADNAAEEHVEREEKSSQLLLSEEYQEGPPLNLAFIGETPEIREPERLVKFSQMELDDIEKLIENEKRYDALYIGEEYLSEAATDDLREVFSNINIPIFFVGTEAGYLPFLEMDNPLSYEESVKRYSGLSDHFISVIWYNEEQNLSVNFSLDKTSPEEEENQKQKVFSNTFRFVEFSKFNNGPFKEQGTYNTDGIGL